MAVLVALAAPASASAAPFGELPFQRVRDGAACLAPTGAPGELSRWADGGVEVLSAGAGGLGRPALVRLGDLPGCPRVDADASGAAIAAGTTDNALRVAVREPGGGAFGAPVTVAAAKDVYDLSVAVSPLGDAVVAWVEWSGEKGQARVRVARRDAGGPFGASVEIVPWGPGVGSAGVLTDMAADGEAVVLAHEASGTESRPSMTATVRTGARGAPLGPAARLPLGLHALAVGVAPDGRVVVAANHDGGVQVLERPRGGTFGAPQPLTDTALAVDPSQMAVAFGADGRTVVAWHDQDKGAVGAALRDGATGFGPPIVIVPAPEPDQGFATLGAGAPVVGEVPSLQAAVAPDGRVSVAWPDDGARLATLSGAAVVERARLGGALRSADGLSLLALPDGRRALAWTNSDQTEDGPARVHFAIEGTPALPEPAAPRVTVGRPRKHALRPAEHLLLPIRCSAACDLEVGPASVKDLRIAYSLPRAGTVIARIPPSDRALAPARPGPVRVVVRSSAPGAQAVTRTIAAPRLRRLPALPFPRIEDVRARRLSGGRVEVRWRTSSDARDTLLIATATRVRDRLKDSNPALDALWGERRTRYRLVLEDAASTRWVRVEVVQLVGGRRHSATVRLR